MNSNKDLPLNQSLLFNISGLGDKSKSIIFLKSFSIPMAFLLIVSSEIKFLSTDFPDGSPI